ncbi:MAG TPA: CRISPR-associated endonuclease Cas1 [Acidimicrobiales bacterium]|nr:CRISPR-associated endonuclease Cas1 [Acidimicrobiales bacterium]
MDRPEANHLAVSAEDRADLHERLTATYGHDDVNEAVAVADGHGLVVKVERGDLEVHDGIGPYRRVRRFARVASPLRRLVVLGRQGTLSPDALAWCRHRDIAVIVLDADGAIFATSRPGRDDARLLRSQAFASGTDTGLAITQYLIQAKLDHQARILRDCLRGPDAAATLGQLVAGVGEACSLEEGRQLEAAGANVYWHGWEGAAEVVFSRRDLPRIPEHWFRFNGRRSAVNPGSPRSAMDPAGAALNYTYRLLEAEAVLACRAIGLHMSLGVLHADMPGGPSFALDVLEPCRPFADAHVLDVLARAAP